MSEEGQAPYAICFQKSVPDKASLPNKATVLQQGISTKHVPHYFTLTSPRAALHYPEQQKLRGRALQHSLCQQRHTQVPTGHTMQHLAVCTQHLPTRLHTGTVQHLAVCTQHLPTRLHTGTVQHLAVCTQHLPARLHTGTVQHLAVCTQHLPTRLHTGTMQHQVECTQHLPAWSGPHTLEPLSCPSTLKPRQLPSLLCSIWL